MTNAVEIKERVRNHYTRAVEGRGGCCGPASTNIVEKAGEASIDSGCCAGAGSSLVELSGYKKEELANLPEDARPELFRLWQPRSLCGRSRRGNGRRYRLRRGY